MTNYHERHKERALKKQTLKEIRAAVHLAAKMGMRKDAHAILVEHLGKYRGSRSIKDLALPALRLIHQDLCKIYIKTLPPLEESLPTLADAE